MATTNGSDGDDTLWLRLFGDGAKSFTLSLIETAIEVSDGAAPTLSARLLRLAEIFIGEPPVH